MSFQRYRAEAVIARDLGVLVVCPECPFGKADVGCVAGDAVCPNFEGFDVPAPRDGGPQVICSRKVY